MDLTGRTIKPRQKEQNQNRSPHLAPFYSVLRAIPSKFFGILGMGGSILILFFLPWLDRSPVKSIRYRGPLTRIALAVFVISFIGLGVVGTMATTPLNTLLARIFSILYFAFFLLMPIYSRFDKDKPVPKRIRR